MTELSKMYADLTEQEIPLFLHAIGFTDAAVIELNGHYAVFLDPCCFSSLQKFKAALAHEIGHCATGCTHRISSPLDLVQKHEYKANRWAVERYLPFQNLNRAVLEGYTEPYQLSEYFNVPEEMIRWALWYYTGPRGKTLGNPTSPDEFSE